MTGRRILAEFDAVDGPFLRKLDRLDRSIGRFETSAAHGFGRVERSMDRITLAASRLSVATSAIAAGFGAAGLTRFIDQAAQIRNSLRKAGDTS